MSLLEFLQSMDMKMKSYEVVLNWNSISKCPNCGSSTINELDEYCSDGYTVSDYRPVQTNGHHLRYPMAYNININDCKVTIENMRVVIDYLHPGKESLCNSCKNVLTSK